MRELHISQYFYCSDCNDFFPENCIVFDNLTAYLTSYLANNISMCPHGHSRSIEKNNIIYLLEKPEKYTNSSILCFDCKDFSENEDAVQFNIQSMLDVACKEIIKKVKYEILFKGTGDGFIAAFKSNNVDVAIDFCTRLVINYLSHLDYMQYRIGISFGTFFSYWGLGASKDIFGSEVIKVCRIADFGNKNVVLLSDEAKKNLFETKNNHKNVSDIGNCIDKHRRPHLVYNYSDGKIGSDFFAKV